MSEIIIGQIAAKHNGNRNARVQAWIVNYRDIALIAIVAGIKYNYAKFLLADRQMSLTE